MAASNDIPPPIGAAVGLWRGGGSRKGRYLPVFRRLVTQETGQHQRHYTTSRVTASDKRTCGPDVQTLPQTPAVPSLKDGRDKPTSRAAAPPAHHRWPEMQFAVICSFSADDQLRRRRLRRSAHNYAPGLCAVIRKHGKAKRVRFFCLIRIGCASYYHRKRSAACFHLRAACPHLRIRINGTVNGGIQRTRRRDRCRTTFAAALPAREAAHGHHMPV